MCCRHGIRGPSPTWRVRGPKLTLDISQGYSRITALIYMYTIGYVKLIVKKWYRDKMGKSWMIGRM
jgi:hypothetical protein